MDSQTGTTSPDRTLDASAAISPTEIEKLVRALATVMRDGAVSELDVAFGSVSIHLSGNRIERVDPRHETAASQLNDGIAVVSEETEHIITSPMIGTFYASPSPGELAFVEIGDTVEAGQVIGIIEAMKIMNEITADRGGVVAAVLVDNGQAVEYGSPLIRLNPASGSA